MKVFMDQVNASYAHFDKFYDSFVQYEDIALDYYADGQLTERSITHPGAVEIKESIKTTIKQWKNPYNEGYIWIKGELLDLEGAKDALEGRDLVQKMLQELESKKKDKQTELEKMLANKTTLKSFFKSKNTIESDKVTYQQEVEQMTKEIEDYYKLINFITIYHGQMTIERFKANKTSQYMRMLNNFAVREISNAHLAATLYHQLLELQDKN